MFYIFHEILTYSIFIVTDAAGELGVYAKCMYKTLRKLKRNSVVVNDILKTLMNLPSVNAVSISLTIYAKISIIHKYELVWSYALNFRQICGLVLKGPS